jgi:predicted NUDIX family phosphoesterase
MKCEIELSPHGELRLHFPYETGLSGHHIDIPPTKGGLELLIETLQRHVKGEKRIAEQGAPTQWQVNKMMKEHEKKPKKKLGVDVSGLAEELDL